MRRSLLEKAVLVLGFVGLAGAIGVAYLDPATGYELSIYASTPVPFWVVTALALVVSIAVVFTTSNPRRRTLGAFLGGVTMTAIVALPIVRGYYYLGEADALGHLGFARDLNAGRVSVLEIRYPIVHTLGSVLHDASGLALHHSLLVLVVAFVVSFFTFVPLVTGELTDDVGTTYVAFYSGLLLLPLNHLAPSMRVHPMSQALLFTPAFLYVFFVLYHQRTRSERWLSKFSLIFLVFSTVFVLLHPQQAANLVAFFGAVAALQIAYDLVSGYRLDRRSEWIFPEVTYYAAVFFLWARTLPSFWRNSGRAYSTLTGDTQFAESTATRSGSLANVGGSLPEVFVKLFLVQFVYAVLTGLLLLIVLRGTGGLRSLASWDHHTAADGVTEESANGGVIDVSANDSDTETSANGGPTDVSPNGGSGGSVRLLLYVFGGLVPVGLIFLVYLVGGISDQYFRHLGMLMVLGTVLGSITLGRATRYLGRLRSELTARRVIAIVLVVFVLASLPVVFKSPYIYYSSTHVTESQMEGYETTFEYQEASVPFDDVRSRVFRYAAAIRSEDRSMEAYYYNESTDRIPDHFANQSLRSYYREPVYVPVTEADRIRDPILWEGFRYSRDDFDYLDSTRGIDKVQSNGGYDLYLVEPRANRSNETSRRASD